MEEILIRIININYSETIIGYLLLPSQGTELDIKYESSHMNIILFCRSPSTQVVNF